MRKVFFSFDYDEDIGRIGQIRNSRLTKVDGSGFVDAADWESVKKGGDHAIKKRINIGLKLPLSKQEDDDDHT